MRALIFVAALCVGVLASAAQAHAQTADFSVTLDAPRETSVGGKGTFEVVITNAGPNKEAAKMRFTRGRGATNVDEGESLRTVSQRASQGSCGLDPLGVICRTGPIAAGDSVKVTVELKVFDSDIPKIATQATVAPELDPQVDGNRANDHVEASTAVRAPIAVEGLPEDCARKPFKISIEVDVPKAKKTKVIVDGKVVATSGSSKLSATIKPKDLDGASHKLAIVVQGGSGGPLASLKRKFKTC
jgi:hypothetical protein